MLICDHIGLVTHSLELTSRCLASVSSFREIGPAILDPHQRVVLCFLTDPAIRFPRIELLEPTVKDSPVSRKMGEGGGVHHLCFQVEDLDGYDSLLRRAGLTAVSAPAFAVAFGKGRRVAFVQAPGLGLVEFVETPGAPSLDRLEDFSVRDLKRSFLSAIR